MKADGSAGPSPTNMASLTILAPPTLLDPTTFKPGESEEIADGENDGTQIVWIVSDFGLSDKYRLVIDRCFVRSVFYWSGPASRRAGRPHYAQCDVRVQRRIHYRASLEPVELPDRRGFPYHRQPGALRLSRFCTGDLA